MSIVDCPNCNAPLFYNGVVVKCDYCDFEMSKTEFKEIKTLNFDENFDMISRAVLK